MGRSDTQTRTMKLKLEVGSKGIFETIKGEVIEGVIIKVGECLTNPFIVIRKRDGYKETIVYFWIRRLDLINDEQQQNL